MKRRRDPSDDGLSLVEVLVGITVFTVLMGLVTGLVVDMLRTGTGTTNRLANVDQLRVSMDAVTKTLRTAVRPQQVNASCTAAACESAFVAATSNQVTFYSNFGTNKVRLTTYQVTPAGALVETLRAAATPTGTPNLACAAGCTTRTLAERLDLPASVFSFADARCADFTTPVAPADIACVRIDLPVEGARDNPGTSTTSTVFLPNSAMGR